MLMRPSHPELQLNYQLPYGAVLHDRGVQFVVFSRSATAMQATTEPAQQVPVGNQGLVEREWLAWRLLSSGVAIGRVVRSQWQPQ